MTMALGYSTTGYLAPGLPSYMETSVSVIETSVSVIDILNIFIAACQVLADLSNCFSVQPDSISNWARIFYSSFNDTDSSYSSGTPH